MEIEMKQSRHSRTDRIVPAPFTRDEEKWAAVAHRDNRADDVFYYSVRTTGVYCRPSCAARLARRENVRFHATPQDAEAAGFRPCKRCRPNELPLAARRAEAISKACRLIGESDDTPDLGDVAKAVGMSRFHFQRVFKTLTGLTPKAYALAHRTNRVREQLKRSITVTEAIYEAGFNSNGRFYATSDQMLGMTPSVFRQGAPGATIRFAVGQCSLGSVLVAASEKGVCAILFAAEPEALVEDLQSRFPKARLVGDDRGFKTWVAKVVGFVEAPRLGLDLPLDIQGTVFQRRVWKALQQIPIGSTLSYSQVARKLGAPGSARAVAQACATNRLAVAIPCHRVVRNDGGISGYRWGVERKRTLLERESALSRGRPSA
ncbi:MAG: bifunctional DNA-binding transcriptional regulator/O6-methylguanine-DNA methyltransferase Ada [Vicinamibacteria bacterium]|nr:bifunctional DNA-binding transcriptional regulator/O6-methylguanine-DNA methyltransferase Ada [Vicinamibacteria bacterium]